MEIFYKTFLTAINDFYIDDRYEKLHLNMWYSFKGVCKAGWNYGSVDTLTGINYQINKIPKTFRKPLEMRIDDINFYFIPIRLF